MGLEANTEETYYVYAHVPSTEYRPDQHKKIVVNSSRCGIVQTFRKTMRNQNLIPHESKRVKLMKCLLPFSSEYFVFQSTV